MAKKSLIEMRQELGELVKQARDLLDKAGAEKRAMTADENTNYENLDKEIERCSTEIQREEKIQAREAELARSTRETATPIAPSQPGNNGRADPRSTDEYRKAHESYLRDGVVSPLLQEARALQSNTDTAGGYLVPTQTVQSIIKDVDNQVFVRQLATKFTLEAANSMGAPALDADPDDADWTSELLTGNEDSAMAFGKRELTPHPLAKRLKISNKLLRQIPSIDAFAQARLAYKFGISQEKAFMTGSGNQQPLGLFTASALGIPTSRDVSTDNSTTAMSADGLINALYSLVAAHQMQAQWIFHRDGVKQIRKLKDGNGQYLWQPGLSGGQPATILEKPFMMSEYAPNTFTAGLYVGIVGDFSNYWIADALSMTVQRLVELYAATNQTGLIGRLETDGMPVLPAAFARVKLAAS